MYCDRVEISSTTRASPMVWCQCLPWGRRHCIQWTTSPGLLGARWPASSLSEKVSGAPRWWLSEDKRERDLRVSEIVSPVLRISGGEVLDHLSSLVHMRTVRMNIPSSSSPSRAGGMNKGALSLALPPRYRYGTTSGRAMACRLPPCNVSWRSWVQIA